MKDLLSIARPATNRWHSHINRSSTFVIRIMSNAGMLLAGVLLCIASTPAAHSAVPEPIARWTFDADARDSVGAMHGELLGDAEIANGHLMLKGQGHVRTAPLVSNIGAKTLVARVKVNPLDQRGGGVITLQTAEGWVFDSIVFGEVEAGEWIAGSNEFSRTQNLDAFPEEGSAGFVQMAITYAVDGTILVYRNGLPYGAPYQKTTQPQLFEIGSSEVLLGMRHSIGANPYLRGEIDEADLYDRALTASEVAELAGIFPITAPNLIVNGGFETGNLSPWVETVQPNSPARLSTFVSETVAQGQLCLDPANLLLTQQIATEPGRQYILSFAYTGRGSGGKFTVLIDGVNHGAETLDGSLPEPVFSGPGEFRKGTWAYSRRRFTAVSASTKVAFDFTVPPYFGALLDDVRVFPAETIEPELTVEWAADHATVQEGETIMVKVRRNGPLDQRGFATVDLRSRTAAVDRELRDLDLQLAMNSFGSRLGLTFLPGQAEATVPVRGRTDSLIEQSETATLHLLPTGNATVRGNPLALTVVAAPTRIKVSGSAFEQNLRGQIVLLVEEGSGGRVRVQTTAAGTATPGIDYTPVDQEVNVAPDGAAAVPITILRDSLIEGEETIGLLVTPISGQTEVVGDMLITVKDDFEVSARTLTRSASEPDWPPVIIFEVTRSGSLDSSQVVHVRYRLEGKAGVWDRAGRTSAAARPGIDFTPKEGLVEFGPGVTRQEVSFMFGNNTDADGPHGVVLRLEGSPEFPTLNAHDEAFAVIEDNEHDVLRQQIPLINDASDFHRVPVIAPASDDGTLVIQGGQITRLTRTGLPDLSFGGGDGQILVPRTTSHQVTPFSAIELPDGGVLALALSDEDTGISMVLRLTASGAFDPSFGGGTGKVIFTNWVEQVVPLGDGFLSLASYWTHSLQRLDSKGFPVPGPGLDHLVEGQIDSVLMIPDPDGSVWILSGGVNSSPWSDRYSATLGRVLPDGRPDAELGLLHGVSDFFGFDKLGRAYFRLSGREVFGDPGQGGLIRFLPHGIYDAAYRPAAELPGGIQSLFCQVFPDGSTLLTKEGNVILEFDPEGRLLKQFDLTDQLTSIVDPMSLTHTLLQVASVNKQADGTLLVNAEACYQWQDWSTGDLQWNCSTITFSVKTDGNFGLRPVLLDPFTTKSNHDPTTWVISESGDISRFVPLSENPQVGFPATGIICFESSIRIPIQRSGNTSARVTVRGQALPWGKNGWDQALAISFEADFGEGQPDCLIYLSLPGHLAQRPIRDYLLRLESAEGLQAGSGSECRLWDFYEPLTPDFLEFSISILSPGRPNPPEISWLLAERRFTIESSDSLAPGNWLPWSDRRPWTEFGGGWSPFRLYPMVPNYSPSQFFRLRN